MPGKIFGRGVWSFFKNPTTKLSRTCEGLKFRMLPFHVIFMSAITTQL